MSATLIPETTTGSTTQRPRAGGVVELTGRVAARRPRRARPAPVVPTDCTACLSAGSVRRGICDICGAVVVD